MGKTQETLQAILGWCVEKVRDVLACIFLAIMYPPAILLFLSIGLERTQDVLERMYAWGTQSTKRWEAWVFHWGDKIAGP